MFSEKGVVRHTGVFFSVQALGGPPDSYRFYRADWGKAGFSGISGSPPEGQSLLQQLSLEQKDELWPNLETIPVARILTTNEWWEAHKESISARPRAKYGLLKANCRHHVAAVLKRLQEQDVDLAQHSCSWLSKFMFSPERDLQDLEQTMAGVEKLDDKLMLA